MTKRKQAEEFMVILLTVLIVSLFFVGIAYFNNHTTGGPF